MTPVAPARKIRMDYIVRKCTLTYSLALKARVLRSRPLVSTATWPSNDVASLGYARGHSEEV